MSTSADVLDRAWGKLQLVIKNKKRDKWAYLVVDGRYIVQTRRSKGRGKISDHIALLIRSQMHLDKEQFKSLLACPLDREGYLAILREKKIFQ